MKTPSRLALASLVLALPALAAAQAGPGVAASRDAWRGMTGYITKAAEQMPDADYAYKPVATVRSFGQLIGHVADAQQMICAAALGEAAPSVSHEQSTHEKAKLVEAMKSSAAYCERAYAQSDQAASAMVTLFGQQRTRLAALALNASHNGEHYGNIVTYLRMKGMVPPSSQQ